MSEDTRDLGEVLLAEPYRFDFFQAVRLLAYLRPGREPVGYAEDSAKELVRFHAHNTLAFPPGEVADIAAASDHEPLHMWIAIMGLTGSQGTLPRHYTELLASPTREFRLEPARQFQEERDGDVRQPATAPLRDFLDVFNHRFISLFYRAWEKYHFPIAYERGRSDDFSQALFALVGLGTRALRRRLRVNDEILLYYSGLLSQRPRSAVALEHMLADYFDLPVHVEQFTGEWFLMNADTLTGLGVQNHQLGVSTVLWERIFDPQARFRVVVGPLDEPAFRGFLPDGDGYARLVELTRFFVGEDLGFEVQPTIRAEAVPPLALNGTQPLGWCTWMPVEGPRTDVVQPLFEARVAVDLQGEGATL